MTLQELKALCERATPGRWISDMDGDVRTTAETEFCPGMNQHIFRSVGTTVCGPDRGDAAFIAAARTALPELIRRLELAESVLVLNKKLFPRDEEIEAISGVGSLATINATLLDEIRKDLP